MKEIKGTENTLLNRYSLEIKQIVHLNKAKLVK